MCKIASVTAFTCISWYFKVAIPLYWEQVALCYRVLFTLFLLNDDLIPSLFVMILKCIVWTVVQNFISLNYYFLIAVLLCRVGFYCQQSQRDHTHRWRCCHRHRSAGHRGELGVVARRERRRARLRPQRVPRQSLKMRNSTFHIHITVTVVPSSIQLMILSLAWLFV